MSTQWWRKTATELARHVRAGHVSSREIVESHLSRMNEVNPRLNAVVRRLDDSALAEADEADRRRARGESLGPLDGVPFTVKENIDVAGTPTTNSVPMLAEAFAHRDAQVVERIR